MSDLVPLLGDECPACEGWGETDEDVPGWFYCGDDCCGDPPKMPCPECDGSGLRSSPPAT